MQLSQALMLTHGPSYILAGVHADHGGSSAPHNVFRTSEEDRLETHAKKFATSVSHIATGRAKTDCDPDDLQISCIHYLREKVMGGTWYCPLIPQSSSEQAVKVGVWLAFCRW